MDLEKYLAVSGLPGLFKLVNSRNNGILVNELSTGKVRFVSARKHQFNSLSTVAIYTQSDSIELEKIFKKMARQYDENPPVDPKGSKDVIVDYFETVVPEYDRERVHVSDMKKVIKWFNILYKKGLLSIDEEE